MPKYILNCEPNGDVYAEDGDEEYQEGIIEIDEDGNLYYNGDYPFGGVDV